MLSQECTTADISKTYETLMENNEFSRFPWPIWAQDGTGEHQVDPNLVEIGPKVAEVGPKLAQVGSKLAPSWLQEQKQNQAERTKDGRDEQRDEN